MRTADVALSVIDLEVSDERYAACRALLRRSEIERAAAFKFERDRRRWCVARAGLRKTLAQALGAPAPDIRFALDDWGKPRLAGDEPLHFNLSHSGTVAVVAVTQLAPVGADVEQVREICDRDAVVRRVFSVRERAQFAALPPAQRTLAFYLGWTRKEAIIKATGEGMRAELTAVSVELQPGAPARVHEDARSRDGDPPWWLWQVDVRPGYVAAVALRHARPPVWLLK